MIDNLTDDNFLIYAIKCYDNPRCIMSEFEDDLKRLKYIRRLIKRYKSTGDLKERLILNHIIVLSNVFGTEAAVRMLFFKIDTADYHILKTFLLFLNYIPKIVKGIKGRNINSSDITIDLFVAKRLKDIH
jgi:hypothetical protein